jgi:hypothetical protein
MEDKQYSEYFSPAELGAIIRQFKLYVSPRSPLAPFRDVDETTDKKSLDKKLTDTAAWTKSMQVLASPEHIVTSAVAGPGGMLTSQYYGSEKEDSGNLVGFWADKDGFRISFRWTPWRIVTIAGMALISPKYDPVPIEPFTVTPAGLTALSAVIDAVKQSQLSAVATRQTGRQDTFDAESIVDQASVGFAHSDQRWLVTLLRDFSPSAAPIQFDALEKGFDELIKAGVIEVSDGTWKPAEWIHHIAHQWRTPLPAAAHEIVILKDDEVNAIRHIITIQGEGPLWLLEYDGILGTSPVINCRIVEHPEYLQSIVKMLQVSDVPSPEMPRETEKAPGLNFCTKCGATLEPGLKFCTSCGQTLTD